MSRVFLTGATGVLGKRVAPLLIEAGHDVSAVARTERKADDLRDLGADPIAVDLFDAEAVRHAVDGHETVMHLATNIPTGASAGIKRGWATNDRLRSEAAANLSCAATSTGATRYIQESITFPYADDGEAWIDESAPRTHFWGNRTTLDAEAAAQAVTDSGATGVVLRFAMFMAADSAHMRTFAAMARRGLWGLLGDDDAFISFVDVGDAAAAVVAALDAPAGTYNIAEAEPHRRADHRAALAAAVGRTTLRPLPRLVRRAGGDGAESLARSHRIDSTAFRTVTGWSSPHAPIGTWNELA